MRRLSVVGVLLALLAAGGRPGSGAAPSPAPPRSLVLISLDTARADHLHCYGYSLPTTPNLDRLAAESALFEQAFASAVNTVPSHVTMFTGLSPAGHGSRFNGVPLAPDFETLATRLAAAGYRTGGFVSGFTMIGSQSGLNRGFQTYDDQFTGQDRRAVETVDRALAWLAAGPKEKPYFLFVHLFDPHGKYDPPAGFAEKFRQGSYPPLPSVEQIPDYQRLERPDGSVSRDPLDYIARYDGEIAYADSQLARILEKVGPDPIIAVLADHGETLVDRGYYFSHGARLSDEAIRVPLIIRFPDPGLNRRRFPGLVPLADLYPTLLATLGQPVPRRLAGRNLLPFLRLGSIPPGGAVVSEARAAPMDLGGRRVDFAPRSLTVSARDARQKLIRYPTRPAPTYELFDLKQDPGESRNLATPESVRTSPLYQTLDLYLAGQFVPPPEVDEETKRKLQSLGYVN